MKKLLSVFISAAMLTATLAVPAYADTNNSSMPYSSASDTTNAATPAVETPTSSPTPAPYVPSLPEAKDESVPEGATELSAAGSISADGTYVLTENIMGTLTISKGINVTIYLNRHNITVVSGYAIENRGTLTIIGTGTEEISSEANVVIYNKAGITASPTLNIKNCTVKGSTYGIQNEGTASIDNCKVYSEQAGVFNDQDSTMTASNSIFYGTGDPNTASWTEAANEGYGIWNGNTGTVQADIETTLTNCWLGGYAGGAKNEGWATMTLTDCDRYYGFVDALGTKGGNPNVVDNGIGNLTVRGGFTEVGGRVTGGNMDIQNVTGEKLIPSGGNNVTIKNCELDKIDCVNSTLAKPATVNIEDVTLKSIYYNVYSSEGLTANVTLKNVTATDRISLTGTSTPHDFRMQATITDCTAPTLAITDNAGATVTGGNYNEITFYNANNNRDAADPAPALDLSGVKVGTLNAGIDAMNCKDAALAIKSGTTVDMLNLCGRKSDVENGMKTSITVGAGATVNDYKVSAVEGKLLKPTMTIEPGAILHTNSYTTYTEAGEKLVSNLGDYCGEGMTLVKQPDGTYAVGAAVTDPDATPTPEPVDVKLYLPPKGTKSADDRLYISVFIHGTDQQLQDLHTYKSDLDVDIKVYGKYSELYRVNVGADGTRDSMFDLEYINISNKLMLMKPGVTTEPTEIQGDMHTQTANLTAIAPIINDSELHFGKKPNGGSYMYTAKLGDLVDSTGKNVYITPRCNTWTADEIFGAGNWMEVKPDTNGVYHINDAKELNYISYLSLNYESFAGKKIVLDKDIDMSSVCPDTGYDQTGYIPIGAYTRFQGEFDGQNHTITGFNYKRTAQLSQYSAEYNDRVHYSNTAGIFGRTVNANIHDINIDNCKILENTEATAADEKTLIWSIYGGVLCGQSDSSTFSKINITNSKNEEAYFGGILLGHTDGGVTISDSLIDQCEFGRKWDDGGLYIGYSCGTTTLERCVANNSSCGAVFIGTPNIGNHYLIDCTTLEVREPDGSLAPIINEIRDLITHDTNPVRGRVYIQWDPTKVDDLNAKTDMRPPQEQHNADNPMPDHEYNDHNYAVAENYNFTYADKMTSRCPTQYTTQKCYDTAGNLIPNKLEVAYFDHYIAHNELRYQMADQADGKHAIRFISECHTLRWDYVGYRVWVDKDGGDPKEFINSTVITPNWQTYLDQYVTNPDTANLNQSSRIVWHTLDGGKDTNVKHDHSDSYFFVRTITDIPDEIWNTATFVVQPYIIRKAESDEANNGVPNTEVTVNAGQNDDISLGAISVITAEDRQNKKITDVNYWERGN